MKTSRTLYQSTLAMKKAIQIFLVGVIIFGLNQQLINAQMVSFHSPETDELVKSEQNVSAGHMNSESSSISKELSYMKNSIQPLELKSADQDQTDSKQKQGESKEVPLSSITNSDEEEAEIVEDWMLSPREWLSHKE